MKISEKKDQTRRGWYKRCSQQERLKVSSSQKLRTNATQMSKMPKIRGYERKKKREITGIEEAVGNEAAVSGSCVFQSYARGS